METFIRMQDRFPRSVTMNPSPKSTQNDPIHSSWYHNGLLSALSSTYCPYNWSALAPEQRALYGAHAQSAIGAGSNGNTVTGVVLEDKLELVDVTAPELTASLDEMVEQARKVQEEAAKKQQGKKSEVRWAP